MNVGNYSSLVINLLKNQKKSKRKRSKIQLIAFFAFRHPEREYKQKLCAFRNYFDTSKGNKHILKEITLIYEV